VAGAAAPVTLRLRSYKAALDLAVHFGRIVAGFSRYHKYTQGTELRQSSRAVLAQVGSA
jgi:hypothetical protein